MANGSHGDHPLTDIFQWKLEVYGAEADDLIRKIREYQADVNLMNGGRKKSDGTAIQKLYCKKQGNTTKSL